MDTVQSTAGMSLKSGALGPGLLEDIAEDKWFKIDQLLICSSNSTIGWLYAHFFSTVSLAANRDLDRKIVAT